MNLLLDTTVLIDVLRKRRGRRELLVRLIQEGHMLATTAINFAEIHAGMKHGEETMTTAFLDGLECYAISVAIARRAGQLKREWAGKGRTLALDDLLIAASALEHELTLMTDNRKDFPVRGLRFYELP